VVPCLVIPGNSSNVRVLSDGRQNAYDSTRASSPILNHTSILINKHVLVTRTRNMSKGKSDSGKLSVHLTEKLSIWLTFPTMCSILPAILVLGPFFISMYLGSKAEQVMKNIKCVCWCVRRQGYNYFHIALSVGSDIECRKPQLKLYEERERKRERVGVFSGFFWK